MNFNLYRSYSYVKEYRQRKEKQRVVYLKDKDTNTSRYIVSLSLTEAGKTIR